VKAYHRFKDKGFEVYGVSLDRTKEDWVQAIREDGLVWTQVSDIKYFECQAAKDYNISRHSFLNPAGQARRDHRQEPARTGTGAETGRGAREIEFSSQNPVVRIQEGNEKILNSN